MTALVTGATGFLGARLVARLLAGGTRVRALIRSPVKAKPLTAQGAEIVVGDITDEAAVTAALDDAKVAYHLAGRLLVPRVPHREYYSTHLDGTRVLLACCRRAPHLERLVHCSTTGVLGVTGDQPADESAPIRPTNVYEATKAAAELTIRDAWREGFPAIIARPGLVYGPGDLHLLAFFRAVLHHWFRPIGRRTVWLHPIYIDDLTEALIRCGDCPAAVGQCFHIAAPRPVALAEFAQAVARAGGTRLPDGHIPIPAARAVAVLGDAFPSHLKRFAPMTSSRLDFLTHSRVYDVTRAQRVLDFTAPTALSTGTARSVEWYRQQGYIGAGAPS